MCFYFIFQIKYAFVICHFSMAILIRNKEIKNEKGKIATGSYLSL